MIEKSVQTMHQIFDNFEVDGEIFKVIGDYEQRQGQCFQPIPNHEQELTSHQILHGLLRPVDNFMEAITNVYAGLYSWSKPKGGYNITIFNQYKGRLRQHIKDETGLKWDEPDPTGKGGTTTTGNTAQQIIHNEKMRDFIINKLPEKDRDGFKKWARYLSVIIRVASQKTKVNVDRHKEVCLDLYRPWRSLLQAYPPCSGIKNWGGQIILHFICIFQFIFPV